jgi:hypothetical protein
MEYKVTVTYNDKRRKVLNENSEYDYNAISRGDFWQLLSDLEKGKIKSFYAPGSHGAEDYKALTEEILKRTK